MKSINIRKSWVSIVFLIFIPGCRPVITVGWQEIAFVVVLVLLLLGPPLYRLARRLVDFQAWRESLKDQKK